MSRAEERFGGEVQICGGQSGAPKHEVGPFGQREGQARNAAKERGDKKKTD